MSGYLQVDGFSVFDSSSGKSAAASCPAGTKVVGGGATVTGGTDALAVITSIPRSTGTGWNASAFEVEPFAGNWNMNARAICVKVAP